MEREEFKRLWARRVEGYRMVENLAYEEERGRTPAERFEDLGQLAFLVRHAPDVADRVSGETQVRAVWSQIRRASGLG